MISKIVVKELENKEKSAEIEGTFEIRINNNSDKSYLYEYIYEYKHWQNILTILVTDLFKKDNPDYKYFLDYQIVRACISDTAGSLTKQDKIEYIKIMNYIKTF